MSVFVWPEGYTPGSDYALQRQTALSAQELIAQMIAQQQYQPTLADMQALQNYRTAVFVPKGWAEWSAYGTTY